MSGGSLRLGDPRPGSGKATRVPGEMTAREHAEAEVRRRDAIFEAVIRSAHRIIGAGSVASEAAYLLEALGRAAEVERSFLWRIHAEPEGRKVATIVSHWTDADAPIARIPRDPLPLDDPRWEPLLARLGEGSRLELELDAFPPDAADFARTHNLHSMLGVPVLLGDRALWGILGFSSTCPRGSWTKLDAEALDLAGSILGGALRLEDAARTLRESEEHYRLMMAQAFDAIFVADRMGRYVDVNHQAAALVGYPRDELLSLSIPDLCMEEDREEAARIFRRVLDGDRTIVQFRLRRADGRPVPIEMSATALPDGTVQAIVRDASERVRAEAELRRRDEMLQSATFAAEAFLAAPLSATVIEEFLERIGRMAGLGRVFIYENYTAPDGETRSVHRHSWLAPRYRQQWADPGPEFSWSTMEMQDWIPRLRRGEHFRAPYEGQPAVARDALAGMGIRSLTVIPVQVEGDLWGVLGLADFDSERHWDSADIDGFRLAANFLGAMVRRRRMEQSLVASEEKYRTLVEGAVHTIFMLDVDGVFRFINRRGAERLGLAVEDVVGNSVFDFFPREFADEQVRLVQKAIASRTPMSFERKGLVRGVERWFDARIAPMTEPDGSCRRVIVILDDISSRKAAEEALLATQEKLRSLTWEVALAEQRERRRLAVSLHDRIGHVLAFAKLKLELLRQSTREGSVSASIDEVAQWLDEAIRDTRALTFELSPPVLHEIGLEAALEWLAERFGQRQGIEIHYLDDRSVKPLSTDKRGFVYQSVQELLVNVAKHSRAGRVVIRTSTADGLLFLSVEDDGVGMDRSADAPLRVGEGGFGLFSIRERLGSIGGRIKIESANKRGTRILLTVPLDDAGEAT